MFDPAMDLMCAAFAEALDALEAGTTPPTVTWLRAREALGDAREAEPEVAAALDAEDAERLRAILAEWRSGKRLLPLRDREVLKRALKAFRKSLKVTRLDDESKIGGRAMTSGRHSGVVGIVPPARYPRRVWDELVRQGRLLERRGVYELPPE